MISGGCFWSFFPEIEEQANALAYDQAQKCTGEGITGIHAKGFEHVREQANSPLDDKNAGKHNEIEGGEDATRHVFRVSQRGLGLHQNHRGNTGCENKPHDP